MKTICLDESKMNGGRWGWEADLFQRKFQNVVLSFHSGLDKKIELAQFPTKQKHLAPFPMFVLSGATIWNK